MGWNAPVDEVALENRLRYDTSTNEILGICREHIKDFETKFTAPEDVDALIEAIRDGKIHFGCEVSC
jgi:hypothetical protein